MSRIEGAAAVFYRGGVGEEYQLDDGSFERFNPLAFARDLSNRIDIRCNLAHSEYLAVASLAEGTLRVWTDAAGLHYRATLPDAPWVPGWCDRIRAGFIGGSSIRFAPRAVRRFVENGRRIVEVLDAELESLGPVRVPAYKATTVRLIDDAADMRRDMDLINALIREGELLTG